MTHTPAFEGYVRAGRVSVWVSVRGGDTDRVPLLLLNGIGGSVELWEPLRSHLDRSTVAFDAPGCGRSRPAPFPVTPAEMADVARRLLRELGVGRADVLGLSLGGVVAQYLALRAPRRVRRLVLLSTAPGTSFLPASAAAVWHLLSPRRFFDREHHARVVGALAGGRTRRDPAIAKAYAELRTSRRPTMRGYYGQAVGAVGATTLPVLPAIRQPTLVLSGDDDALVATVNSRVLARVIPRAELQVIAGGGHLMAFDTADEIAARVTEFLDR